MGSEQLYKRRQFRQDHWRARVRVFNLRAAVFSSGSGPSLNTETRREAYLSAEQDRSQAAPWFPQAHGNGWRPQDSCAPAREGPQSPVGMRPVTDGCMATAQVQPPRPPSARIATLKRRAEFLRIRKGARFATPASCLRPSVKMTRAHRPAEPGSASPSASRSAMRSSAIASGDASRRRSATLCVTTARSDFDYVLIARRAALDVGFAALVSDLIKAFGRVHAGPRQGSTAERRIAGRADPNQYRPTSARPSCCSDQDNQKNLLLAIVLSVAVLLAWQLLLCRPEAEGGAGASARIRSRSRRRPRSRRPRRSTGDDAGQPRRASSGTPCLVRLRWRPLLAREAAIEASPRVRIETPSLQRLDLAHGRAHRRSGARQVPRDGRSQEPQRRAVLALRERRIPTTPSTAGWRAPA